VSSFFMVTIDKILNICYRGVKHIKPMKKLILLPLITSLFSVPVQAQQVNEYQICTRYRETYVPGYYDRYGNYVSGSVRTQSSKVPCGDVSYQQPQYVPSPAPVPAPRYYSNSVYCNPTQSALGALLGGGVAASMSRGNGYYWSVPVGAAVGGALFGCNRY